MRSNLLIKNTTIYAIGDIFPKLFSFITFPILTTHLIPAEYGIINYVNTVEMFLTIIGFLCLNTYYLVYYYRVGDGDNQKKLLGNLSIFVISINVLLSIFLFCIGPLFFSKIGCDINFYPYIALGVASSFFNVLSILPSALYRVQERPLPLTIINIIKGLLVLGLTIFFVLYKNGDAKTLLYIRMIVYAVFGVLFLYITNNNAIWSFNWKQIKEGLVFALPLLPGTIASMLYTMFDRILIEKYLSLSDLGIYSSAAALSSVLMIISNSAYKAFEPFFFKTFGLDNFNSNFLKVRNVLLFVVLIIGLCISLFAKEFFEIFSSSDYSAAQNYVPCLIMGQILSTIALMYGTVITAMGKTKINAMITILGGGLSVLLNSLLLRHFGVITAALVSIVTYAFILLLSHLFAKIHLKNTNAIIAVSITFIAMCFPFFHLFNNYPWVFIAIKVLITILISFALMSLLQVNIKSIYLSLFSKNNNE